MNRHARTIASLAAFLATPLLGCSDSTGPASEFAGTWVREELYQSFSGDEVVPTTIPDTLVLFEGGVGVWSYGNYVVDIIPTPRTRRQVTLERDGPVWLLRLELCDPMIQGNVCFTPTLSSGFGTAAIRGDLTPSGAPRRTTMADIPWRVTRSGNVLHVAATFGLEVRQRYVRRAFTIICRVCDP